MTFKMEITGETACSEFWEKGLTLIAEPICYLYAIIYTWLTPYQKIILFDVTSS